MSEPPDVETPLSRAILANEICDWLEPAVQDAKHGTRLAKEKTEGLWLALQRMVEGAHQLAIEINDIEHTDAHL